MDVAHSSPASMPARRAGARISKVAVLGAGTMGAQIAAHFANAGVPVWLLDLDSQTARDGLERAPGRFGIFKVPEDVRRQRSMGRVHRGGSI